ncbi:MAG: flagellar hook-length control protein FliK [Sulfurimicrobium sp.]
MDFAALMAAQFQGKGGAALPASGIVAEPVVAGDGRDLKTDAMPDAQAAAADPALQAMTLMPAFVPAMQSVQQAAPGIKLDPAASLPGTSSGDRLVAALASQTGAGLAPASDKAPMLAKEGAAEFAVDGKSLPSGDLKDGATQLAAAVKLPIPPLDARATPDAAPAVSVVMNANQAPAANEVKLPVGRVDVPVSAAGWGDAVGQKLVWMAGQHQQVAELHLNPPHLGPMEVRLTINNDQVSAIFVSHQPSVREAIEAAMPRLREMFADSGMMLGNAMVSSDSLPQQQNAGQEGRAGSSPPRSDFPLVDGYPMPVARRGVMALGDGGSGMVDLFA